MAAPAAAAADCESRSNRGFVARANAASDRHTQVCIGFFDRFNGFPTQDDSHRMAYCVIFNITGGLGTPPTVTTTG